MDQLKFKITSDSTRSAIVSLLVNVLARQEELAHTMISILKPDKEESTAAINAYAENCTRRANDILEALYIEYGILDTDKLFEDD